MISKKIIVHGQNINLQRSGGSGRYVNKLYEYLSRYMYSDYLSQYRVHFCEFKKSDSFHRSNNHDMDSGIIDKIKTLVHRTSPPIIYEQLEKFYSSVLKNNKNEQIGGEIFENGKFGSYYSADPTLFHEVTNYSVSDLLGRMSLSDKNLLVVTFLDIQDFFYPEYFTDETLIKRRLLYSYYKDRANYYFAISQFTKETMIDRLKIPEEKILVTHLAADDLARKNPSEAVVRWVNSFGRYWIYPAKAWKHKNHSVLIKAVGRLASLCKKKSVKLLLTGGFTKEDTANLKNLILENGVMEHVQILGFVSDEQLQALIRGAEYMIFPSLFEGFGMPILEAMCLGCPVLASNAGSLSEIGGNAVFYFDPSDDNLLTDLLKEVLSGNGPNRESLISRGFENCKRFSWNSTVIRTIQAYNYLLENT